MWHGGNLLREGIHLLAQCDEQARIEHPAVVTAFTGNASTYLFTVRKKTKKFM